MPRVEPIETLRQRTSEKWTAYPDDVLPMFVAEMDFPLAPAIKNALREAVDRGDTGYVNTRDNGTAVDRGRPTSPGATCLRSAGAMTRPGTPRSTPGSPFPAGPRSASKAPGMHG